VTQPTGEPEILSLAEAMDRLASPYEAERWSVLSEAGALVVDLPADSGEHPTEAQVEAFAQALSELACPTIALSNVNLSPTAVALLPGFDVVLEAGALLSPLLARIRANPLSSLALVQLLRHNAQVDVHQGLMAESWVYSVLQSGPEFGGWLAGRSPASEPRAEVEPAVLAERSGPSLRLCFNRPSRHNAFGVALRDALAEGLRLALSDSEILEVVLCGRGPSFCSGGDLSEFGTLPDPATAHAVRSTRNVGRLLHALKGRGRAEVHGACIGAGVELPAFVDRVIAHEAAFFELPEVALGLVPGAGGTVSLTRRIGRQRTAWLALSGERIDASTALSWGLVDEISSADNFGSER